eukprot:2649739-Rhodomonas_salina.1
MLCQYRTSRRAHIGAWDAVLSWRTASDVRRAQYPLSPRIPALYETLAQYRKPHPDASSVPHTASYQTLAPHRTRR